jgi:Zn finger protein HypA/HybF involved in hydrogenase expression
MHKVEIWCERCKGVFKRYPKNSTLTDKEASFEITCPFCQTELNVVIDLLDWIFAVKEEHDV